MRFDGGYFLVGIEGVSQDDTVPMNLLRVCLAQINPTVGALHANAERIAEIAHVAVRKRADLIVFPEMALSGYPPEDLVLRPHFLADVERFLSDLERRLPTGPVVLVGAPRHAPDGARFNSAFAFAGGRRIGVYDKMLLPNYGVFDEVRLFRPGERPGRIRMGPWRIGIHICEDSWHPEKPPCVSLRGAVDFVVNLSSSPYFYRKIRLRERVLRAAARAVGAPLLYCNLVGGQDELVFDGGSIAIDESRVWARAGVFEEDLLIVDMGPATKVVEEGSEGAGARLDIVGPPPRAGYLRRPSTARIEPLPSPEAEVYAALQLGLRDYVRKNGFHGVVVGLSGGIDSALTATIAVDALGPNCVHGISMPSRYTSPGTRTDARRVAESLGISFIEQPIERLYTAFLEELTPHWRGRAPDVTEENLQARIRGVILMAFSNKFGWLAVTTGNKSEVATGYCTLYGDMAGGFAVLKDVPKTLVYRLARWRNRQGPRPVIPPSTIRRAPTAELRENQKDQDTLPPYPVLDGILERYVERDEGVEQIVAVGYDAATVRRVARMVDRNEYKRRQAAPGVKITPKAFGRDRRIPITNAYDHEASD